jgi:hypothetical protein
MRRRPSRHSHARPQRAVRRQPALRPAPDVAPLMPMSHGLSPPAPAIALLAATASDSRSPWRRSERPHRPWSTRTRAIAFAQEDASAPIGGRTTGFNRKEAWSAGRTARSPSPKRERPSPVRQVPIRAKVQHLADRALRDPASRRGSAARRSPHASRRMQHDRVAASLT